MLYRILLILILVSPTLALSVFVVSAFTLNPSTVEINPDVETVVSSPKREVRLLVVKNKSSELPESLENLEKAINPAKQTEVFKVPFYSQFNDISQADWKKVGCGIASLAMLISYYEHETVSVDGLLKKGISNHAYLDSAGWVHSGLINLSHEYGLDGESKSVANLNMSEAFSELEKELETGPVMASVHYTFEPTNPIPHLVVVNGVSNGKVFYNDPAEENGGGSLSIEKFQKAWKKRYIAIRPIS